MASDRHPDLGEQTELVDMLHERLNPLVGELAERYDLPPCMTIRLMALALRTIHTRVHMAEVVEDPRWN